MRASTWSIRRRLNALLLLAVSVPLVLACTMLVAMEVQRVHAGLVRRLTAQAEIIADNCEAPVAFNDPEAALRTLRALQAEPHIVRASVYTANGGLFATYTKAEPPARVDRLPGGPDGYSFEGDRLRLVRSIRVDGATIGRVRLEADLLELRQMARQLAALSAAILLLFAVSGLLALSRLRREITEPLERLAGVAEHVTRSEDYSVRLQTERSDEFGLLGEAINRMLAGIQVRDAQLREAVRARDEFLAIAAHELKTPLTSLRLIVQSLRRSTQGLARPLTLEEMTRKLATADRQVARFDRLIVNLLEVSRITGGRLDLELERFDAAAVVHEVLGRFDAELAGSGSALQLRIQAPSPCYSDRLRFEHVVTNLISNAIKFGQGRPIDVELTQRDGRLHLLVRDHGIGVAPADQARIFERFERAVSLTSYGGFGLGLWITRQFAEAMGGLIRIDSTPGEGAGFTVELPVEVAAPRQEPSSPGG